MFPFLWWAIVGVPLLLLSCDRRARRRTAVLLCAWLVAVAVCQEEARIPLSWGRQWPDPGWIEASGRGDGIRVVSANCGGGAVEALEEALSYEPDVLLLQEAPPDRSVRLVLEERPEYSLVPSFETAILARGDARPILTATHDHSFTAAEVTVQGRRIQVVNAHLSLPYLLPWLWSPSAWRSARRTSEGRIGEVAAVAACIAALDPAAPVVVGGDWNSPPGDPVLDALPPGLRDSFREAGIGLGATIVNDMPVSRIDHVYIDEHLRAVAVVARRTAHSDHRFVVADLTFAAPE